MRARVERQAPAERRGHVQVGRGLRARGDLHRAVAHDAEDGGLAAGLHERVQMRLRERAEVGLRRVGERTQLGAEPEARVGIAHHEAVRVEGEEDVAQRPLGDVERTRELADAHRAAALGDGAQDARGFVDRRHRT